MKDKLTYISFCVLLTSCGMYLKLDDYSSCEEYYALSTKSFKIDDSIKSIISSFEKKDLEVKKDTIFSKNEKWVSPQLKVYGYKNPQINYEINYINFIAYELEKTTIQIHGICFEKSLEDELSVKKLKEINKMVKTDLLAQFIIDKE